MTSLTMTQVAIEGRPAGDHINVAVEPSKHVGDGIVGVYVRVNDHHAADDAVGTDLSVKLMETLEKDFDSSVVWGEDIIDHVMSLAEG